MATVALVVHPRRAHAADYARTAAAWLSERGHSVLMPEEDAAALEMAELGVASRELAAAMSAGGVDLVVALGGDGTVLRAVRVVAPHTVPVLGVNLGRLGYLIQIGPDDLVSALQRFLAGDYAVDERMMLALSILRGHTPGGTMLALNDAVLEKPRPGQTVRLATRIGDRPWVEYAGDGLIVATPTGSTAYSFSARGPILSPGMRGLLLTPVSAHMGFDRSLVVGGDEPVRVEVSDDRPAALTVDGRDRGLLRRGDSIVCRAAAEVARLVTFGEHDFYGILKSKLGVPER